MRKPNLSQTFIKKPTRRSKRQAKPTFFKLLPRQTTAKQKMKMKTCLTVDLCSRFPPEKRKNSCDNWHRCVSR